MSEINNDDNSGIFSIVGRPDVDLTKYLVSIAGRKVIDYDKLKLADPELYVQILQAEEEENRKDDLYLENLN